MDDHAYTGLRRRNTNTTVSAETRSARSSSVPARSESLDRERFDVDKIIAELSSLLLADELSESLRSGLALLTRATEADDAELFLCEPEGHDSLSFARFGRDEDSLSERDRFAVGEGFPGLAALTRQSLQSDGELGRDSRFLRPGLVARGLRSAVTVPLFEGAEPFGAMQLLSRRDDFPVEAARVLLERAALPISNALRAGLAALRRSIDAVRLGAAGRADDNLSRWRAVVELIRGYAGARAASLSFLDAQTGRIERVVSTSNAVLVCVSARDGAWHDCPSAVSAHGLFAVPGRRHWPAACRRGLTCRVASPCCLPLAADGALYGLVILDLGRDATALNGGRLVPLLTMAHQAALRLRERRDGFTAAQVSEPDAALKAGDDSLELQCFGEFAVLLHGRVIQPGAFARSQSLVLLKLLALKPGALVHREALVENLWPEVDPRVGFNRLHGVVHDLRSVIEPPRSSGGWRYVRNNGEFYFLDTSAPITVDTVSFRAQLSLAEKVSSSDRGAAIEGFERAIALYRGALFEDEPYAEWCEIEREALRVQYTDAVSRLVKLYRAEGRDDDARRFSGERAKGNHS